MSGDERAEPSAEIPQRRRARPRLRSSERELKAFVSSVMRGRLNAARQVVVDVLDGASFIGAWAFEFTPPSPEPVDDTYLRHVREADLVIWIAGAEVTPPVVNEIREALASRRELIIVRYGSEARSAECEALLAEVGLAAKYGDASDDDELAEALGISLSDMVVRAMRGEPSMGRLARLDELGRASRARCVVRWRTVGLSRRDSLELASDPEVGAPPPEILPSAERPVVVLTGPLGAGKSTCADRHHQRGITALMDGDASVLPVWLRAREVLGGLAEAVVAACDGLGQPRLQGAAVVVDGLDEAGADLGEALLGQARELVDTWPNTTIMLTTRPGSYTEVEERLTMPPLSEDDAWAVVSFAEGRTTRLGVRVGLAAEVADAIRFPLFALLFGLWRRQARSDRPGSRAELLAFLGDQALRRAGEDARELLRRLAVASVERELRPVPLYEIGRPRQLRQLVDSGLVTVQSDQIAFGLAILAQWFAADALLESTVEPAEIASRREDLDLWLHPLSIALATGTYADSVRVLTPLIDAAPGFAFQVIDTSLGSFGAGGTPEAWAVAGERIQDALAGLASGVMPLAEHALPVTSAGQPLPLGIATDDLHVWTAWWDRGVFANPPEPRPRVFALPADFNPIGAGFEWRHVQFAQAGPGSAWPWRFACHMITDSIGHMLKARNLPLDDDSPLAAEEEWQALLDYTDSSPLTTRAVAIGDVLPEIEERLDEIEAEAAREGVPVRGAMFQHAGGRTHDEYWLRDRLRAAKVRGIEALSSPLPLPDRLEKAFTIDDGYSDEQLLGYATALYRHAIEAYVLIVDRHLPKLRDRMVLATTLPAQFVGAIERGGRATGMASLYGYFMARPPESDSDVTIRIVETARDVRAAREAYDQVRRLRPDAARWITAWAGGSGFNPAARYPIADVVAMWLWRDLRHTSVVQGHFPAA